ncbi:MAG: hypothetical protein NTY76_01075 [Candidatus Omnitrophica bacterium]|nr:hypothetical protein [Candidatus Omnitrophota bacterium]
MMEERLIAHQDPIDEFIKDHANLTKSLSSIPYLEEDFKACITACGADNMLNRLKVTLSSSECRIQVIFVKSEDELPIFSGKKVWGHSGTYVTVFALDNEKDSKEGRRKIIARLFHEIRARSTKAKELFDEEFKDKNPTTSEEISAFIISTRKRFENDNLRIEREVGQGGRIENNSLRLEFANLTFAVHPDVINRDYAMSKKQGNVARISKEISFDPSVKPESLFPIDRIKAELARQSVPIDLKVEVKEMTAETIQLRLFNGSEVLAALTMVIPSNELEIEGLSGDLLPKTNVLATDDMYYTVTKTSRPWQGTVETRVYHNLKKRVEIRNFIFMDRLRRKGLAPAWYQNHIEPYLRKCGAPVVSVFGKCLTGASVFNFYRRQGFDQDLALDFVHHDDTVQRIMLLKVLPVLKAPEKEAQSVPPREQRENKIRPIEQLNWEDEAEVLDHFRALLAELGWPLPRVIPIDGNIVESVAPKPLNIASLKKLAQGKSPDDYLRYLRLGEDLPELYDSIVVPSLKEFGILPLWSIWFRYKDQLKSIKEYVDTLPKYKSVKILVHAVWQGEDAYAIAIMLKHFYPNRVFEIVGTDFIEPNPQELNWVYVKRIPKYLRGAINKYFIYKTKDVVALKDEYRKLITLRQGDMREPGSFSKGLDIVVINAALGQSVAKRGDIRQSIENVWASLTPGGRFYTDNSAYKAHPAQRIRVDEILRKDFVETGKFNKIDDGVFEKVDISEFIKQDVICRTPPAEKEAQLALPQEWYRSEPRATDFTRGLAESLSIENILNPGKSTFIFSEKVTFDNGLGVFLPKLAKSGMKVAVIATNDRQRALIDELNQGRPENERIIYADTIIDIRAKVNSARCYYFKVNGDPDTDLRDVTTFDITDIVKKIIGALGKVSGIVERERLELLHEAARKFAQAA